MIPGYGVTGTAAKTLLIRAVGPTLGDYAVPDAHQAPQPGPVRLPHEFAHHQSLELEPAGLVLAQLPEALGPQLKEFVRDPSYTQAETVATEDAKEGIAALLAKRPPVFTGR